MNTPGYRLRRATLDDLEALKALWHEAQLPVEELEKRFTEFQVLESANGKLIGAIALQIHANQARLHTEVLAYPDPESELRAQLWTRVQSVARNHGLTRLWTLEASSFWHQQGFEQPTEENMKRLPPTFGDAQAQWRTVQLREETALISADKDFELFKITQKEETDKLLRQARIFKFLATLIAAIFFLGVIVAAIALIRQNRSSGRR